MKKLIVATLATSCVAVGAFAQGSIGNVQSVFANDGITTPGLSASSPANATTYYTGNVNLSVYYAANLTASEAAALNAADGNAPAQLALLAADGFTEVSATTLATTGETVGSVPFAVSDGGFTGTDPNQINLIGVPTGTTEWLAIEVQGVGGSTDGGTGILTFQQNTGGNPYATPAGIASLLTTDPAGLNFVLAPVPEPTTMALAALGGAAMLMIRRKK